MGVPAWFAYSDKTAIVVEIIVAVEAVVIIVDEEHTALWSSTSIFSCMSLPLHFCCGCIL